MYSRFYKLRLPFRVHQRAKMILLTITWMKPLRLTGMFQHGLSGIYIEIISRMFIIMKKKYSHKLVES